MERLSVASPSSYQLPLPIAAGQRAPAPPPPVLTCQPADQVWENLRPAARQRVRQAVLRVLTEVLDEHRH
jgi:hypothetical protein